MENQLLHQGVTVIAGGDAPRTIPVTEEQVHVNRVVEQTGAVRVRIETTQQIVSVPTSTSTTHVVVDRVAKGIVCTERVPPYQEEDVLVVPVYSEVPVTTMQLMLVEEIRIARVTSGETALQDVALHTERAVVERLQPDGSWKAEPAIGHPKNPML